MFEKLSDDELLASAEAEFAAERKIGQSIFLHLQEILVRRLYAKRGYHTMHWMLVRHFGQSESAANQRLKALELMRDVPGVEEKLEDGSLTMSAAAMTQRKILLEEKKTGKAVSSAKKNKIVELITGKTLAETETELFKQLPATATDPKTFERRVSKDAVRLNLTVPNDVCDMMNRLKELWAHVDPTMDQVEVMRRAFKIALEKVDPLRKKPTQGAAESAKHRGNKRLNYYGKEFDRALHERSGSQCEYVGMGRRCECKFGLEREHVIPLALGGTNELSNMQLLCRTHNDLRARQAFGNRKIDFHQREEACSL